MNEIQLPEKDDESSQALAWLGGFQITSAEDFKTLDGLCVKAKEREKRGEELFRNAIEEAHEHHKGLIAKLKGYVGPAQEFRRLAKDKMFSWSREQERLRAEEERKLQAEAKKLAEQEALESALEAEKAGDEATAELILQQPLQVAPVVLTSSVPKKQTTIRMAPDLDKIEAALARGVRVISGVHIYQAWHAKVIEPKSVPDEYKRVA